VIRNISSVGILTVPQQILSDSFVAKAAQEKAGKYMRSALKAKPPLATSLVPSFPVGCRRITPGEAYLKSLLASNVSVIAEPVQICAHGIKLKREEIISLDAIICATGFDCSFVPRCPLLGEHGNLQDI
jgi:cation diffusion facilitator CzcD-associated flavoprotein CzcO